jgi:hypothetical protein
MANYDLGAIKMEPFAEHGYKELVFVKTGGRARHL